MQTIHELLSHYLRLAPPDTASRRALSESIRDVMNVDVPARSIKIVNTVAYVDIDSMLKSALFMRQNEILKRVEERLGRRGVSAIR